MRYRSRWVRQSRRGGEAKTPLRSSHSHANKENQLRRCKFANDSNRNYENFRTERVPLVKDAGRLLYPTRQEFGSLWSLLTRARKAEKKGCTYVGERLSSERTSSTAVAGKHCALTSFVHIGTSTYSRLANSVGAVESDVHVRSV